MSRRARYGYRLGIEKNRSERFYGETWLTIPRRSELALRGLRPNPSDVHGSVVFSLPDDQPARFEVFDVRGRCVLDQQVGSLGAGTHVLPLDTRLPPGLSC